MPKTQLDLCVLKCQELIHTTECRLHAVFAAEPGAGPQYIAILDHHTARDGVMAAYKPLHGHFWTRPYFNDWLELLHTEESLPACPERLLYHIRIEGRLCMRAATPRDRKNELERFKGRCSYLQEICGHLFRGGGLGLVVATLHAKTFTVASAAVMDSYKESKLWQHIFRPLSVQAQPHPSAGSRRCGLLLQ